jgi:hypothetical protein
MWPSKKDEDIKIPPGRTLEIGFGVEWIRGKNEVVITTEKERFVLDGKNELFLEITSSNADSIKVQIVPDFKKRIINVVEIIDANATCTNRGKISFAGVHKSKDDTISIDKFLKAWDENIETFGKRIHQCKIRRNIFIILGAIIAIGNAYLFTINNSPMRYINAFAVAVIVYILFRLLKSYRDLFRVYDDYKKQRSQAFEVVKNE